eukprot:24787_1
MTMLPIGASIIMGKTLFQEEEEKTNENFHKINQSEEKDTENECSKVIHQLNEKHNLLSDLENKQSLLSYRMKKEEIKDKDKEVMKSIDKNMIFHGDDGFTSTNKSYVVGSPTSSQPQSPPPNNMINNHNNNQKIIYSNRLNKTKSTVTSPPPGNSLFEYTFDTKFTFRSPKRRSSFSSLSSDSASDDILNLTNIHNTHSDTPPRQQTQINNELLTKRSDKFDIQRNRNVLSTKSVTSGTFKFIYNKNTPIVDASNDVNDIYESRSKSNSNILDDSPSPRTTTPDMRIKYEPKQFIGRRRAASFETKQNILIAQKQAFIKINRNENQIEN